MSISPVSFGKLYIPGTKTNRDCMAMLLKNETDYRAAQDSFARINAASGDSIVYLEMKPLSEDTLQLSVTDSVMVTTALAGKKSTYAKQKFDSQNSAMMGINKDNFKLFADKFEANYLYRENKEQAADKRAVDIIANYQ